MRRWRSRQFKMMILWVILLMFGGSNGLPLVYFNGSDVTVKPTDKLEEYVIKGAACFLKSYASFMQMVSKLELSRYEYLNSAMFKTHLNDAIQGMSNAIKVYEDLNQAAEERDYVPGVTAALRTFDYETIEKSDRLIKPIFGDVRRFLVRGDIRGVYLKTLMECRALLKSLNTIQEKINTGNYPGRKELRDLNQEFARSMLFGQYVARVFLDIKKDEDRRNEKGGK